MPKNDDKRPVRCSFCGKSQDDVKRIITGNNVFICDECVRLCVSILDDDLGNEAEERRTSAPASGPDIHIDLPKPQEINASMPRFAKSTAPMF